MAFMKIETMCIEINLYRCLAWMKVKMFIIYWGIKYTTHSLKLSSHRLFLHYKERDFPTGKIYPFHSNHVIKISITLQGTK